MQSQEMAPNDGKTLKHLSRKAKSSRLCTNSSTNRKKYVPISFLLSFVKNAIQLCTCYKCPCKFSFLVNVFVFSPSCLLSWKYSFKLLARLQTRDINVGHQIRLRGDDNFSSWLKKKNKKSFLRICGRAYFV